MDSALDKVAKGIDTAQPKIEEAVRKTLGEDAAKKVHDVIEQIEHALEDVSSWGKKTSREITPALFRGEGAGVGEAGSGNGGTLWTQHWQQASACNSACSASASAL